MNSTERRFIFTDYDHLKKVKIRKLDKVCQRLFLFIPTHMEYLPLSVVTQIQKLGKMVKWMPIKVKQGESLAYPMVFVMGRIHQKVNLDVEFAIFTEDKSVNTLVDYINGKGRSCLRMDGKTKYLSSSSSSQPIRGTAGDKKSEEPEPLFDSAFEDALIQDRAKETVRRLVHSGNRPSEVETLKRLIQLYNQELAESDSNLDLIIRQLENDSEIAIRQGVVTYNF